MHLAKGVFGREQGTIARFFELIQKACQGEKAASCSAALMNKNNRAGMNGPHDSSDDRGWCGGTTVAAIHRPACHAKSQPGCDRVNR